MPAKIVLVLDHLVERDLVFHQKSNLDVQLVDVLFERLVLTNLMADCLAQPLKLDLFVEVEITVIEQVDEILDSVDWRVLSGCEAFVGLSLKLGANETLDFDHLLHVLVVMPLLLLEFRPDDEGFGR